MSLHTSTDFTAISPIKITLHAVWGKCTHCFHMHCLLKWLNTDNNINQLCPMDRRKWGESRQNISSCFSHHSAKYCDPVTSLETAERDMSSHGVPNPETASFVDPASDEDDTTPAEEGDNSNSMMTIGEGTNEEGEGEGEGDGEAGQAGQGMEVDPVV